MTDAETQALHAAMEPASLPYAAFEVGALISIAISLKRLADMAEKIEAGGVPTKFWSDVNAMAYEAGLNFRGGNGR